MKIKDLAILPIVLGLTACNEKSVATPATESTKVSQPTPMQTVKKADGIWIDVRSADEYNAGHLDGAVNVTHEEIGNKISGLVKDKNAPINLYCRSGRRAELAKTILTNMGYTSVTNHGGYDDLVKKGLK